MNSNNIAFIALLFLLLNNNTINSTQLLLLLALITSTNCGCFNNLFCPNNANNFNNG